MKFQFIFLLFLVANFSFAQQRSIFSNKILEDASTESNITQKIQTLITSYNSQNLFNGQIYAAKNGIVYYNNAIGVANKKNNISITSSSTFRIGSITKQFTAMLIMQLVQQGRLQVTDKVVTHLPWLKQKLNNTITIHHLLTHTSGIPNYTDDASFNKRMVFEKITPLQFAQKYFIYKQTFTEGTQHSYCNTGYYLLGLIIEANLQIPYKEALQQRIFNVLGMLNTGIDNGYNPNKQMVTGYEFGFDGYQKAPFINMETATFSAGAMFSCVQDLSVWDKALYTNILLNEENRKLLFTPFIDGYAYGWIVRKQQNFLGLGKVVTTIAHGGGINGFSSMIGRIPEDSTIIILLDNTHCGTRSGMPDALLGDIVSILNNLTVKLPNPTAIYDVKKLIDYEGIEKGITLLKRILSDSNYNWLNLETDINSLGEYFLFKKNLPNALNIYKLNVELFPKSANVYLGYAEVLVKSKQYKSAINYYKKCLELEPGNNYAKMKLGALENN